MKIHSTKQQQIMNTQSNDAATGKIYNLNLHETNPLAVEEQ